MVKVSTEHSGVRETAPIRELSKPVPPEEKGKEQQALLPPSADTFVSRQRGIAPSSRRPKDVYKPEIGWSVNQGMNPGRMHKLYSLFCNDKSSFYLKTLQALPEEAQSFKNACVFENASHEKRLVLFNPDHSYNAFYSTMGLLGSEGLDGLGSVLDNIKRYCLGAEQPTRFVIPITEVPVEGGTALHHATLFVLDYDPSTKTLIPTVLDSIGRGTVADRVSSYFKGREQSTADRIINKRVQEIFAEEIGSVRPLHRIAYNHQNRALEGNCGSYVFKSIYETMSTFAQQEGLAIPLPGYITSDSYLTPTNVREIEDCVSFQNISPDDINTSLRQLGAAPAAAAAAKAEAPTYDVKDFITAVECYIASRKQQSDKWLLSMGYSKKAKIEAATALFDILGQLKDKRAITSTQLRQLEQHKGALTDGDLSKLISFYVKQAGFNDLDEMLAPPSAGATKGV